MVPIILKELHGGSTGGHFGITKTLRKFRERFYFPTSRKAVTSYCHACDICAAKMGPPRTTRGRLHPMPSGSPGDRWAMDILGPLPRTPRGSKYVLVVMDYFTKWPELLAIPDQSTVTVADALVDQVITRFGVPCEIHSDQGRNFESEVMAEVFKILGTEHTRTTPLRPQSDGMVERANRTILQFLSKFVDDNQEDWDRMLPMFGMAYRSAVHEASGFTPAMMTLGHEIRLPVDLKFGRPMEQEEPHEYVENLRRRMDAVHQEARKKLCLAAETMKTRYDRNARPREFRGHDRVWFYNPRRRKGRSPKLQSDWEGPYRVVERINDVVYRIQLGKKTP
uniref:RNA-directed DNA polymerase n=1 Tax=Phlebotomus papatasi TaxID=29031 RepID=A0A1B0D850_PHLPP